MKQIPASAITRWEARPIPRSCCKETYSKGKAIPGVYLKKLNNADGDRLEGVACHDKNIVVDARIGSSKEGGL